MRTRRRAFNSQSHDMFEMEVMVDSDVSSADNPVVFSRQTDQATRSQVASDGRKLATSSDDGPAAMKLTNSS